MPDKTIKTDETVHEELERLKGKHGVDTFNDVLRLELGIDPGPDIDKLSAFLNDELREDVNKIISDIENVGEFSRGYDRINRSDYLTFEIPDSGRKVAQIEFEDGSFRVEYRNNNGEMEHCISAIENGESVDYRIHATNPDEYDRESARDAVREKVTKAYQRWS